MQTSFWRSAAFWLFITAAIPFWLCLIFFFDHKTNFTWFREHVWTYLLLGAALPVLEEIVFRGFLQEQLSKYLSSRHVGVLSYANILTSIIFSLLHLIVHSPAWALLVLVPSLIFGYFKDRFKTLGAPIALHVFYNAGYFLIFGAF